MDNVNKTLYIPLYGKSFVSRKGIILQDPKAEEIWEAEGFALKGKSKSKWLAYYMGMRAAVFDRWVRRQMKLMPGAAVLHIGCGMDSRVLRIGTENCQWYDVDFPDVIAEREKYYQKTDRYQMLRADVRCCDFLSETVGRDAIVVMEGISMYLQSEELKQLLEGICTRFERVSLLMDCYTGFAAKASRYKNPINDVGVTQVYGIDDPRIIETGGLVFLREHDMTPADMIDALQGMEKAVYKRLYAGSIAKKMYRLYEYGKE